MPTEQDVKFSDFIRSLPAATENDLSAGNNMPLVRSDDVKKLTAEAVAGKSFVEQSVAYPFFEAVSLINVNGVYFRPEATFSSNAYHKCYYYEVNAGEVYKVNIGASTDYVRIGFSDAIPAVGGSCTLIKDIRNEAASEKITIKNSGYIVIGCALSFSGITLSKGVEIGSYIDEKVANKSGLKKTYEPIEIEYHQGHIRTMTDGVPTIYDETEEGYLYSVITSGFSSGEKIYITAKLSGDYRCGIAFYNGTTRLLQYWSSGEILDKKEFIVPNGTTEIRLNSVANLAHVVYKESTPQDLDVFGTNTDKDLSFKKFLIENSLRRIKDLQTSVSFKPFSGGVAAFVFDDTKADIDQIAALFKQKGLACCFSAIPSYLDRLASNGDQIRKVLQSAQADGCEVLCHGVLPVTSSSTDEEVYNTFVAGKRMLEESGLVVDGIIEIGGTGGNTFDYSRCWDYLRMFYSYSDGYGKNMGLSQYYLNNRVWLTNSTTDNRTAIDNIKNNNRFTLLSAHGVSISGGIGISVLEDAIDYCIAQGVGVVTVRKAFDTYRE